MSNLAVTAVVAVLSAVLGAGGMWSFASTWLSNRHQGEQSENARLHEDLRAAIARHAACEEKVDALERRLDAIEHHHSSLVPRWVKNANKRLLWVNGAAMVSIFGPLGLKRDEVEGHTFVELFGMETAREIDRLDRSALARPGGSVSTFLQLHPMLPPMRIVKVAGVGRDSELIYEGYAYWENDPAELADRSARREEEQLGLSTLRLSGPAPEDPGPE